jgi:hypothetical protein
MQTLSTTQNPHVSQKRRDMGHPDATPPLLDRIGLDISF